MYLHETTTVTRWAIMMLMIAAFLTGLTLSWVLKLFYGSDTDMFEDLLSGGRPPIEMVHRHCLAQERRHGQLVMVVYKGMSDAYECPVMGAKQ